MSLLIAVDKLFERALRSKEIEARDGYYEDLQNSGIEEKYIIQTLEKLRLGMKDYFDFPMIGKILIESKALMQIDANKLTQKVLEARDKKHWQECLKSKNIIEFPLNTQKMLKPVSSNDLHVSGEELQRIKQRVKKGF